MSDDSPGVNHLDAHATEPSDVVYLHFSVASPLPAPAAARERN